MLGQLYEGLKGDPEDTAQLQHAEHLRWEGSKVVLNPRVRQVLRIPDPADLVPIILSEDGETVWMIIEQLTPHPPASKNRPPEALEPAAGSPGMPLPAAEEAGAFWPAGATVATLRAEAPFNDMGPLPRP